MLSYNLCYPLNIWIDSSCSHMPLRSLCINMLPMITFTACSLIQSNLLKCFVVNPHASTARSWSSNNNSTTALKKIIFFFSVFNSSYILTEEISTANCVQVQRGVLVVFFEQKHFSNLELSKDEGREKWNHKTCLSPLGLTRTGLQIIQEWQPFNLVYSPHPSHFKYTLPRPSVWLTLGWKTMPLNLPCSLMYQGKWRRVEVKTKA